MGTDQLNLDEVFSDGGRLIRDVCIAAVARAQELTSESYTVTVLEWKEVCRFMAASAQICMGQKITSVRLTPVARQARFAIRDHICSIPRISAPADRKLLGDMYETMDEDWKIASACFRECREQLSRKYALRYFEARHGRRLGEERELSLRLGAANVVRDMPPLVYAVLDAVEELVNTIPECDDEED